MHDGSVKKEKGFIYLSALGHYANAKQARSSKVVAWVPNILASLGMLGVCLLLAIFAREEPQGDRYQGKTVSAGIGKSLTSPPDQRRIPDRLVQPVLFSVVDKVASPGVAAARLSFPQLSFARNMVRNLDERQTLEASLCVAWLDALRAHPDYPVHRQQLDDAMRSLGIPVDESRGSVLQP